MLHPVPTSPVTAASLLAQRVTTLLDERKMTQGDFAVAIGRSRSMVSQVLSGSRKVSIASLDKIAGVLEVPVASLFLTAEAAPARTLTPREVAMVDAYRTAPPNIQEGVAILLGVPHGA